MLRCYTVFNAEQTEGCRLPADAKPSDAPVFSPIEACDAVYANMPNRPKLEHGATVAITRGRRFEAYYTAGSDMVVMPRREDYLAKRLASGASRWFGTLAPVIHARTDGNPLFMVNMVDYLLVDAGLLLNLREVSEAEWAETLRADRLDALRSIRQMIERNLERLKPEEQAVLEGASVAGAEFSSASVAAALECPQHQVALTAFSWRAI